MFIMLSFVDFNLDFRCRNCKCDYLTFYLAPSCTGSPVFKICRLTDAIATTYQTDVLSIGFITGMTEHTGFKLLYSLHSTEQPPIQLRSGMWVCSGARGQIIAQHFVCSSDTHCDNSADRLSGTCPPVELCGGRDTSVVIDGRCHRYISPKRRIRKSEADAICRQNKGHLVSLNTEREWRKVADFWQNHADMNSLLVGLQLSSYRHLHDT
ncbi:hypothetical protein ACOMHN_017148 [Nucella lapillus]